MAEKTIPQQDGARSRETTRAREQYVQPAVDIYEDPSGLTVLADLPGSGKDDVTIEVENDILTIQAKTRHTLEGEPLHREFELASYFRQFQLSDTVDNTKINAEFKHGVLKLHLPRAERAKPKQIQVSVE
jgi:HSP20 family protein